jgi:hypothetical protein
VRLIVPATALLNPQCARAFRLMMVGEQDVQLGYPAVTEANRFVRKQTALRRSYHLVIAVWREKQAESGAHYPMRFALFLLVRNLHLGSLP